MSVRPLHILSVIIVALLLSAVLSCSGRQEQVRQTLTVADSLMMTQPQAALDALMSIDSSDAAGLPRADKAFYTLLRTEAEYKCWLPVAGNTAIAEAVDYYHRREPEDRLARALVMQGAVLYERGDTEGAMLAYKEAEPILEHSGDLEQLGLLHTKIASLYQNNIFNTDEAIVRYRKALKCFEKAELKERIMYTHLSLASIYVGTSEDSAMQHLKKGFEMASISNNRQCGINAYNIYTTLYNYKDTLVINASDKFFSEYGRTPLSLEETAQYNGIYYNAASSCLNLGLNTKATELTELIVPSSAPDSLILYSIQYDIAAAENNWDSLKVYKTKHERIFEKILRDDYESYILEIEKKYDNDILSERLKIARNRILALTALLLLVVAVSFIIYFAAKNRAEKRELALRDAVNDLQSLRADLLSKRNEAEQLQSVIHDKETALGHLKKQIETEADRHNHEAEEIRGLRESLISQISSNRELLSINGEMLGMAKTLADICYVYEGSPNMPGKVEDVLKSTLSDKSTSDRIQKMFELAYPGFMARLSKEYPSLNDSDRKLTALVCCGFTPNTASIIMGTGVQSLNARKYRLARKMGIDGRISTFLKQRLDEYNLHTSQHVEN